MKKLSVQLFALLFAAAMVTLSSCNNDDDNNDPTPENPIETETIYEETELKNDDDELVEVIVTVTDLGEGAGTMTWESNKTYVLNGKIFVNDGQTLTIQAGTVIKGKSGLGENASALIVARGGKLMAEGAADNPIIFCAEADETRYDHTQGALVQGSNIPMNARGLWGGLIVLGKGETNNTTADKQIEGIPTDEQRARYGGTNNDDNSGVIKYVSIRNGGADIGEGNEINGLTMGAVGSGTVIDYVEVIANKDDGFEWFGSTVTCKHLISALNGDDSFDYDEGYRGLGQYWFVIQDPATGDRIGEHDGGPKDNEFGEPYAKPTIFNVTYMGRGEEAGKRVITFRDNAGGTYANSIFANQAKGIDIEWLDGSDCSYTQFADKDNLMVKNNIFWMVADGTAAGIFKLSGDDNPPAANAEAWAAHFEAAKNMVADPGFDYNYETLNPIPTMTEWGEFADAPEGIDATDYKGAFAPGSSTWADGWSKISTIWAE